MLVTFKIFDQDHDGLLSEQELLAMIKAMLELKTENIPHLQVVRHISERHVKAILPYFKCSSKYNNKKPG